MLERTPGESDTAYIARIKAYVETTYSSTGRLLLRDSGRLFKHVKVQDHTYDDYLIDVTYDR